MKKITFAILLFLSTGVYGQDMFSSISSKVHFFSDAPLEKIEAVNEQSKSLLNISKKEVGVVIPIISFKFKSPLMEEHFNENYMETEKFKTASFRGTINEEIDFKKEGTYPATATGKLTIHGVEKEQTLEGTLTIKGNKITLDSKFKVALEDHNIKIPTVVVQNLAEVVDVDVHFDYEPKK